jgi:hypothetical protein
MEFSAELSCDGEESWVVPKPPYHETLESECTELERVRRGLLRLREADLQTAFRDLELNVHLFRSVWSGPPIYHNGFYPPMFPLQWITLTVYIVDSLPSAPPRTPVEQQRLKYFLFLQEQIKDIIINKCKIIKRHTHTHTHGTGTSGTARSKNI